MSDCEGAGGTTSNFRPPTRTPPLRRTVLLFATYVCVLFVLCATPSLMTSMMHDEALGFSSSDGARVVGIATVGTGLGKVLAGHFVSKYGPTRIYFMSVCVLIVVVYFLTNATTVLQISVMALLAEVACGAIYPAHACIIRGHFPDDKVSIGFTVLALASRGGDIFSKLVFGVLIAYKVEWRLCYYLCFVVLGVGLGLGRMHKDTHKHKHIGNPSLTVATSLAHMKHVIVTKEFWSAATGICFITVVKQSGHLMGIYFHDVTDEEILDEGQATQLGAIFQLGLVASVLCGGWLYSRAKSGPQRVLLCTGGMMLSTLSSLLLVIICDYSGTSRTWTCLRAFLVFVTAFGTGANFYVPAGKFSVQFGGAHTATVSAGLDFVGMLVAGVSLSMVIRPITSYYGWRGFWVITTLVCGCGAYFQRQFVDYLTSGKMQPLQSCIATSLSGPSGSSGPMSSVNGGSILGDANANNMYKNNNNNHSLNSSRNSSIINVGSSYIHHMSSNTPQPMSIGTVMIGEASI